MTEIRMSLAGLPFQACPRCGQERVPSFNGIRLHDEFCPALIRDGGPWRGPDLEEWLRRVTARQHSPDGAPMPSRRQAEREAPDWEGPWVKREGKP